MTHLSRPMLAVAALALLAGGAWAQEALLPEARRSAALQTQKLSIRPLSMPAPRLEEALTDDMPRERLFERARSGDPAAHYRLGLIHLSGAGGPRDLVEAFAHIRVAAESGHPRAINLFYTLGAKLTGSEHARAHERAAELGANVSTEK